MAALYNPGASLYSKGYVATGTTSMMTSDLVNSTTWGNTTQMSGVTNFPPIPPFPVLAPSSGVRAGKEIFEVSTLSEIYGFPMTATRVLRIPATLLVGATTQQVQEAYTHLKISTDLGMIRIHTDYDGSFMVYPTDKLLSYLSEMDKGVEKEGELKNTVFKGLFDRIKMIEAAAKKVKVETGMEDQLGMV